MTRLHYIGKGAFYNVPARDLSDADFAERAAEWAELGITEDVLLASGLYRRAGEQVEQPTKKRSKRGAVQDADKDGE